MTAEQIAAEIFIRMAGAAGLSIERAGSGVTNEQLHFAEVAFKYADAFIAVRNKRPSTASVEPLGRKPK